MRVAVTRMAFVLSLAGATLAATPVVAAADTERPPVVAISLLETLLLSGDYDVSIADASLQAGPAAGLGLYLDLLALAPLQVGAQALVLQRDSADLGLAHSTVTHIGAHVGAAAAPSEVLMLGAAALCGVQTVDFADAEVLTRGLGLGLIGYTSLRLYHWVWLRAQAGVLWQPTGGHDATDVTMPPTPFFGLGFGFGVPAPSG